jgi:tetratricopeptide (TPR) repeat protein
MSVLSSLMRSLGAKVVGRRTWTPAEVRDLLDKGQIDEAATAAEGLPSDLPERELQLACLRGEIAYRRHDDAGAERLFREALVLSPGRADAHYGLSLVMLARGELEVAVRHAQFAANNGDAPRFSAQLGLCQLELGNIKRAGDALYHATSLDPHDKASWNNLGIARRAVGDMRGARTAFARALEIDPNFERAAANAQLLESDLASLGVVEKASPSDAPQDATGEPRLAKVRALSEQGQLSTAIDHCETLCAEKPDDPVLVAELAQLYERAGDGHTAFDVFRAFQVRHPDDLVVAGAFGQLLVRQNNFKAARTLIEKALEARPEDTDLLLAMAEIRCSDGRYEDAGQYIERAAAVAPSVHMKGRLAANLLARCRYEEGLRLVDEMLAEDPSVENSVIGLRCNALTYLGRYEELLPELDEAIARNPHDPYRRFSRASIKLLTENFTEGWLDYSYRNLESTKHLRMLPFALWDGGNLDGKTILVVAEQGLGDQVMFASCLPDLLAAGPARVIVEAVDRVAPTIARSFPQCEVIASNQDSKLDWVKALGHVDCFVMMGDLPRWFRRTREEFPNHSGYLQADPVRVAHWRRCLDDIDQGRRLRIGISWRGGTEATRKVVRTTEVAEFAALKDVVPATWVCLQYGEVSNDLERAKGAGLELNYWPESIKSLDDFSAIISALDLVITVCNTTVHYAGAVGRPVWVLAPKIPEWRYGLHSTVMPWYPSSRMFRQSESGDWQSLVARVAEELSALQPRASGGKVLA